MPKTEYQENSPFAGTSAGAGPVGRLTSANVSGLHLHDVKTQILGPCIMISLRLPCQ